MHCPRSCRCWQQQQQQQCEGMLSQAAAAAARQPLPAPRPLPPPPPAAAAAAAAGGLPRVHQQRAVAATATGAAAAGAAAARQPHGGSTTTALSVGQQVEVTCERLGTGGMGVCLRGPSRLVLLVRGALPGEVLVARVTAVKKTFAEASKVASLAPHHNAVEPHCHHFGVCGGCSLQSLSYEAQLAAKAEHVTQLLTRVGKFDAAVVAAAAGRRPPVAAEQQFRYRNKLQLAFSSKLAAAAAADGCPQQQQQQQDVAGPSWGLGFLLPGSSDVVLPISDCWLAPDDVNALAAHAARLCRQHGLEPHNSPSGAGSLRFLIIRTAAAAAAAGAAAADQPEGDGQQRMMAVFVTTLATTTAQKQQQQALQAVAGELMAACPRLTTVVHSTERERRAPQRAPSSSSRGAQPLRLASSRVLAGPPGRLVERMAGLQLQVSPHSFFQTNTQQAELLYHEVVVAAAEAVRQNLTNSSSSSEDGQPQPLVLDLYTGTGSIACCLAAALPDCKVVGFDVAASSIADATANAALNGFGRDQLSFVCGDLDELLPPAGAAAGRQAPQAGASKAGGPPARRRPQQPGAAARPRRQHTPPDETGEAPAAARGQGQGAVAAQQASHTDLAQLRPRVVVVDPARAGLGPGVVQYLQRCGAERVIYVSCNAATQARDLRLLCGDSEGEGGSAAAPPAFRLTSVQAVDLFPQTAVENIETVAVLDRVR